jgi:hypothetical protein
VYEKKRYGGEVTRNSASCVASCTRWWTRRGRRADGVHRFLAVLCLSNRAQTSNVDTLDHRGPCRQAETVHERVQTRAEHAHGQDTQRCLLATTRPWRKERARVPGRVCVPSCSVFVTLVCLLTSPTLFLCVCHVFTLFLPWFCKIFL